MGRSLLSSPFNSTSAAFLFWFLLWFACILAFSFELRVDVASLELTFGCFHCFVQQFPLLCLLFAVVFSSRRGSCTEIEISVIRIAVRGLQFLLKNWYIIWQISQLQRNRGIYLPTGTIPQDKTNSFVYKITFVDETYNHPGRHYFVDSAE